MTIIYSCHKILSHAKLGVQSRNMGCYSMPACSRLKLPLTMKYFILYTNKIILFYRRGVNIHRQGVNCQCGFRAKFCMACHLGFAVSIRYL